MNCPECDAASTVFNSRTRDGRYVYRRRRCLGCDYRFSTYEQFTDDLAGIRTTRNGRVEPRSRAEAPEMLTLLGQMPAEDAALVLAMARRLAGEGPEAHADLASYHAFGRPAA